MFNVIPVSKNVVDWTEVLSVFGDNSSVYIGWLNEDTFVAKGIIRDIPPQSDVVVEVAELPYSVPLAKPQCEFSPVGTYPTRGDNGYTPHGYIRDNKIYFNLGSLAYDGLKWVIFDILHIV